MATAFTAGPARPHPARPVWHILALSFIAGMAQAFGGPAYQSLVPTLVHKKDLPNAIALNSIQFNLARVFGPLLSSTTMAAFGAAACFGLNGLSFLVVIVALMSLHGEAPAAGRAQADAGGDEGRLRLRPQRADDHRAHRARVDDDVPGTAAADVPADLRAGRLPRRRRHLQPDDGVLRGRRRRRRAGRRVARTLPAHGVDAAARAGRLRRAHRELRAVAHVLGEQPAAVRRGRVPDRASSR